ncbi:MAG TPA: hypothetical protein VG917_01635 [Patescibacteria group bacterium]|nr:hypothetical protein [Patescibacteria group bacterium]
MHEVHAFIDGNMIDDIGFESREELAHLWQASIRKAFPSLKQGTSIPVRWIPQVDYYDGGEIALKVYFPVSSSSIPRPKDGDDQLIDQLIADLESVVTAYGEIEIDVTLIEESSRSKTKAIGPEPTVDP